MVASTSSAGQEPEPTLEELRASVPIKKSPMPTLNAPLPPPPNGYRLESGNMPDQLMEWVQASVDELTTARNTLKV